MKKGKITGYPIYPSAKVDCAVISIKYKFNLHRLQLNWEPEYPDFLIMHIPVPRALLRSSLAALIPTELLSSISACTEFRKRVALDNCPYIRLS